MKRTVRARFDFDASAFSALPGEVQNRLLFDWWCDDGDRHALLRALQGRPLPFHTRCPRQDDPAPPMGDRAPQGFRTAWILSSPSHVARVLEDRDGCFSNIPYAALGGGSFLLAQDPGSGDARHAEQAGFVRALLARATLPIDALRRAASWAVEGASRTALARPDFDLASFAEQAGLRYLALVFGFGFQDHPLLEAASRDAYRALQYIAVGQHFTPEPLTVAAAQQSVGRLVARVSGLADDYFRLQRSPHRFGAASARHWPTGVQPWSDLGLGDLGRPLLAHLDEDVGPLSGRSRAIVASMLVAGTLGNIVSAVCLLVRDRVSGPNAGVALPAEGDGQGRMATLAGRLARRPPVPVLPRRAMKAVSLGGGVTLPAGDDCLLALEGGFLHDPALDACPHAWGRVAAGSGAARHPCLGEALAWPLIAAAVPFVLDRPGLAPALDPLTGEGLDVERLWGFGCTSYPLRHDPQRTRVQQNLIVSMPVKSPAAENVPRLREVIAAAALRIDDVLSNFGGVHFAWFEFDAAETRLVLRTIYDGPFEAYIRHFALSAGDVFDGLFEFIDNAPPRPVAEHPDDFVETIRRFNLAPLGGYLYSAYPRTTVGRIRGAAGSP